ncbi:MULTISPECIES: putative leader peptide [unclassified Streptomyces]
MAITAFAAERRAVDLMRVSGALCR